MRTTIRASAVSALAVAALVAGAGTAAAEKATIPERLLTPAVTEAVSSLGYGSLGTGSLMDLLTGAVGVGSTTLSVGIPNLTGSYAPGSFGSYGPEASLGEILIGSVGPLSGST